MTQNKILKEIYLEFPLLRLINGRIFNKLSDAIKKNNCRDLFYINKYLTNNNCKKVPKVSEINSSEENDLRKMYDKINQYISLLYSSNNLTLGKIFKKAKKKSI